jgi:hypothetical protein
MMQANKIPSLDTLNFVMESLACGHTVMGHRDAHEAMANIAETTTLEDINALARYGCVLSSGLICCLSDAVLLN